MNTVLRDSGASVDLRRRLGGLIFTLTPAGLALVLSLPTVIGRSIGRDSGVFLYAGQELLRGGFPYIDAWDHKGPLLYLLNAAGARLAGGDIFGVLLLETILVSSAVIVFSVALQGQLGRLPVALAGSLGVATFFNVNEGGNMTETWTFPFALIAYALFVRDRVGRSEARTSMLTLATLGIAIVVAALIRPSNGLGLSVLALFAVFIPGDGFCCTLRRTALLVASGSVVALPVLSLVARAGALEEMWRQYVVFNVDHSTTTSIQSRVESYAYLFESLARSSLTLGLSLGALALLRTKQMAPRTKPSVLWTALLLASIADAFGVALSGRGFAHYLVTLIPPLTVMAAIIFSHSLKSGPGAARAHRLRDDFGFVAAALLVAISLGLTDAALRQARGDMAGGLTNSSSQLALVANEIAAHTSVSDTVYVWGAETRFLAAAQRRSSSSITYLYPIIRPNRAAEEARSRLEAELEVSRPSLIIRTAKWPCPFEGPCSEPLLQGAHAFIAENYVFSRMVGETEFWVPR